MNRFTSPKEFVWSPFQMEGGRTQSVWGRSFYDPVRKHKFQDDRSPDVASDFYHK